MKTQHTPTPWQINKNNYCKIEVPKINSDNTFEIAMLNNATNAAHIVKCVNLHDELVEALNVLMMYGDNCDSHPEFENLLKRAKGGDL